MTTYESAMSQIVTDVDRLSVPLRPASAEEGKRAERLLIEIAEGLEQGPKGSPGVAGLAANQVGLDVRVIVVKIDGKFKAFINPIIIGRFGVPYETMEGCFSLPGQQRQARRFPEITYKAQGILGVKKLRGKEAQAFQHEVDHLNGVLI